jgi:hypothetical protein
MNRKSAICFTLQGLILLKDNEKPPEKPRKGLTDGSDVAGASPEILMMSDVVDGRYIFKHIKERIRIISFSSASSLFFSNSQFLLLPVYSYQLHPLKYPIHTTARTSKIALNPNALYLIFSFEK